MYHNHFFLIIQTTFYFYFHNYLVYQSIPFYIFQVTEYLACPNGRIGLSKKPFLPCQAPFIPRDIAIFSAQYRVKPRFFGVFILLKKTNIFICCCNLIFIYYLHKIYTKKKNSLRDSCSFLFKQIAFLQCAYILRLQFPVNIRSC